MGFRIREVRDYVLIPTTPGKPDLALMVKVPTETR